MKKKLSTLLITTILIGSLTACGSSTSPTDKNTNTDASDTITDSSTIESNVEITEAEIITVATVSEATESGTDVFNVTVPKGFGFIKGDSYDPNDENLCTVKKSEIEYFTFAKDEDAKTSKDIIDHNKTMQTNNLTEINTKVGNYTWIGYQYDTNYSGSGFEVYLDSEDMGIRISSIGYDFDSETAKSILESLEIK